MIKYIVFSLLFTFVVLTLYGQDPIREKILNQGTINPEDTTLLKSMGEKSANPPMQVTKREVQKSSYKTYQKIDDSPERLQVFGSSFFNTPSLSFEPNLRIATPTNYVLGPDDELILSVSGYQEANIRVQVQPEGIINIPQAGVVLVSGLTIEDATVRIRNKMAQTAYPNLRNGATKLNVSLGKIRSIHVTLIGAAKPGNYTVSSLTTVFNSLYQSGGPDDINTYRSIELIRNNKVYRKIDLYQFLTKGDQSGNVLLKENDVINFPVYKKRVTILGEVKRPGIFEMLENETLDKLLFLAGGFTEKSYKASVKIKQVTDTERRIKDLSKAEFSFYKLNNGDEIQVDAILDKVENSVSIKGAVYRPGQFEFTSGLTLKQLIEKADGLQEGVFTDRAILTRINDDKTKENISFRVQNVMSGTENVLLQKRDEVEIAYKSDFNSAYSVQIEGEIRKPGSYPFKANLSLKDLLFSAGSFTDAASSYHIEIGRRIIKDNIKLVDTIAEVIEINTDKDLAQKSDDFILKPFDVVTVRKNPGYTEQKQVTINGEVAYPGKYTIRSKQERVSDLLKRSGGLTSIAYKDGIFLTRKSVTRGTEVIQADKAEIIRTAMRDTSSKVQTDIEKANVKIAINAKQILESPGSIEDYVLEEGDVIDVLTIDPLIKMSGEVLLSTKTNYVKGKSLNYYLGKSGGTTENAKRSKIYVLYPNGKVSKTHTTAFGLIRTYPRINPGSEIIVPAKAERNRLSTGEFVGLTSAFVSLASLVIITINSLSK
jgi:protein involved in polysaccharide export with SLBB domain